MRELLKHLLMRCEDISEEYIEDNLDILCIAIPEIKDEIGFSQKNPWHIYDVWGHTKVALSYSNHDLETRIALLLHDIGKPHCFQDEGNIRHFKGHAQKSAEMVVPILEKMGFVESEIDPIVWLVSNHSTPIDVSKVNKRNIEKYKKLLHIQYCDCKAYNPEKSAEAIAKLDLIKAQIDEIEKGECGRDER